MGGNSCKGGYVAGTLLDNTSTTSRTAVFPSQTVDNGSATEKMHCVIGKDEEPDYKCYPYRLSKFRFIILILFYICTAGFMWLIFYWRPDWKLKFTHYPGTFEKFDSVYLEALDGTDRVFVSKVKYQDASVKELAPYLFNRSEESNSGNFSKNEKDRGYQNSHVKRNSESSSDSGEETEGQVRYFCHHIMKFMWEKQLQTFVKVEGFDGNVTFQHIHDAANRGFSQEKQQEILTLFGDNTIHVEVPSYLKLLISEVLNPFYVFQLFACIFWMVDEYVAYATAIIIISFISAVISLIGVRRERQKLHDMVEYHNQEHVQVVRQVKTNENGEGPSNSSEVPSVKEYVSEKIWIKDLVPGDIVIIPPSGMKLSFDAALISGTCIVNESTLTGESVPVTKTPLSSSEVEMKNIYSVDSQKAHTLFCGTDIIQTRYYRDEVVRAVVVRTGFGTAKGLLVHSILYPKPVDLKLLRDAYRFVGVMCGIALFGFGYSTYIQISNEESIRDILFKSIDVITITVPPALPLAMTIGIIYAQSRLKKVHIHTISPQRINICGQVDVVAFDKTGTLTEEGLDLTHIIPVREDKFLPQISPNELEELDGKSELIRCMTTCHSLTLINNQVSGDPLDLKMFEATGWELVEPKVEDESKFDQLQTTYVRPPFNVSESLITLSTEFDRAGQDSASQSEYEVGIIRQFPFLSSLQRASVIVKPLRSDPRDMIAYVKGAPETIAKLCLSIPNDFSSILKIYTEQGHRVIALSYKPIKLTWLKAQKIERGAIEKDLHFIGFLILQNKLKPKSAGVIRDLDHAHIRTVMVTGDNLETAICVARDCKILKPNIPILIAKCDNSSTLPTLTWQRAQDEADFDSRKSPLSSADECYMTDTVIPMGDSNSPYHCHLAVTGHEYKVIREYFPQFVPSLAVQGTIFARMSPGQKTELMEDLESVDYHVLMCGDGANDCGALKRAHVGLSLSECEASVAAPFTARSETDIESVPALIREGRAALVTSFGMFKFMALYSMIQFTTVLLLYRRETNLSDYQFLYIDLIIIDIVAITMSRNHANKILHWNKPPASLVCVEMLVSLFIQIFLQFGFQILPYILVQNQCWFASPTILNETESETHDAFIESTSVTEVIIQTTPDYSSCPAIANRPDLIVPEDNYQRTYETTCLFFVSSFMYLSVSVSFSRGKPFRTPIYKNRFFLISLLILAGFTCFLMFGSPPSLDEFMDLWHIPDLKFLFIICGIIIGHLISSILIEVFFIENPTVWNYIKSICCACNNDKRMKKYKKVQKVLNGEFLPDGNGNSRHSKSQLENCVDIYIPTLFVGQPIHANDVGKNANCSKSESQDKTKF